MYIHMSYLKTELQDATCVSKVVAAPFLAYPVGFEET